MKMVIATPRSGWRQATAGQVVERPRRASAAEREQTANAPRFMNVRGQVHAERRAAVARAGDEADERVAGVRDARIREHPLDARCEMAVTFPTVIVRAEASHRRSPSRRHRAEADGEDRANAANAAAFTPTAMKAVIAWAPSQMSAPSRNGPSRPEAEAD